MKNLILGFCLIGLIGCSNTQSVNGVKRPSLATTRHLYVKNFPVGLATKQEVLEVVGTPDKTYENNGTEQLTYIIRNETSHKLEYTYFIKSDIVVDVKCLSHTPLFGNEQYQNSRMEK